MTNANNIFDNMLSIHKVIKNGEKTMTEKNANKVKWRNTLKRTSNQVI